MAIKDDQGLTLFSAVRMAIKTGCRIRRYDSCGFLNGGWIRIPKEQLHLMPPLSLEDFTATDWSCEPVLRTKHRNLFGT